MPDSPALPSLGRAVTARRTVIVVAAAFFLLTVLTEGPPTGPSAWQDGAFRLLLGSAALACVLPWLVWLRADPGRVVLGHDELYAPTILGWRRVRLRPLRASVVRVRTRYDTERRWRLANGLQPIVLVNPYVQTAELVGGEHWPGMTLEEVLVRSSGVRPGPARRFSGVGAMLLEFLGLLLWIPGFTLAATLWILRLRGRL